VTPKRFSATISQSGTRSYIVIPFSPDNIWGARERHHITGRVNGCRVRGALVSNGKEYFLPLGPAWLEGHRKNYIRWIESAKRPETRAARISEMMKLLNAGRREK
jgi:hypothetical protein